MADASAIKGAEQLVFGFETRNQAVEFSKKAMQFMKEQVMPNESVSLEIVVTGTKAIVATTVFYDTFKGSTTEFVKPLEQLASGMKLPTLARAHWASWYEAAAALWPVIAEQKGNPLATSYHCAGTTGIPDDAVLDFVGDVVVGEAPLDEAEMSIVEIRTLGGEAQRGPRIPSGNCDHAFFVDLVTLFDASAKSPAQRQEIVDLTNQVVDKSRAVAGLDVDFSGTHSQPDDVDRSAVAAEIFGSAEMSGQRSLDVLDPVATDDAPDQFRVRTERRPREEGLEGHLFVDEVVERLLVETGQPLDDLVQLGLRPALLLDLVDVVGIDRGEGHLRDPGIVLGGGRRHGAGSAREFDRWECTSRR